MKLKFEYITSIVSLALSVLALVLAFDANQVARQETSLVARQVEADVTAFIVGQRLTQITNLAEGSETCNFRVRLLNEGGAGASIIDYKVNVAVGSEAIIINAEDDIGWVQFEPQSPAFRQFLTGIYTYQAAPDAENHLPLPLRIPEFSSFDATLRISFILHDDSWVTWTRFNLAPTAQPDGNDWSSKAPGTRFPIVTSFDFNLSNGESVRTNAVECGFVVARA